MATLKEQRAAAFKAAQDLLNGSLGRDMTEAEQKQFDEHVAETKRLDAELRKAAEQKARVDAIGALEPDDEGPSVESQVAAKTLGDWFVKHAGDKLRLIKGVSGASVAAPEFKAATDTHVTGTPVTGPYGTVLTEYDRTIVRGYRMRLVVADLLSSGTISGNAISYFVEGAIEGAFTTVAEGGAKPQLHVVDPTTTVDSLKKIAGWTKFSDEMLEDLDFIVSEINIRLLYELAKFEEAQILNGNGTGTNLLGLLNRVGIQTELRGTTTSGDTVADTLFRAITKVSTGSGLDADALVIHPLDYQALRLAKDANEQYYGGGFFQGPYGNGGIQENPPVWGLRTVVTPAMTQGTALVGAFAQAATLYRKGGVRVESTNAHASDFTSNLVTMRVEERVALAVRRPTGLVKTTLTVSGP